MTSSTKPNFVTFTNVNSSKGGGSGTIEGGGGEEVVSLKNRNDKYQVSRRERRGWVVTRLNFVYAPLSLLPLKHPPLHLLGVGTLRW